MWCEAEAAQKLEAAGIAGRRRQELIPCPALAIWTTPPGPSELQAALKQTDPEVVFLFGVDPEMADRGMFLKRLAALVKYALNNQDGQADLQKLAAATAQGEFTVRTGLECLAARGDVKIISEEHGHLTLTTGNHTRSDEIERTAKNLKDQLEETAAYRTYFNKADKAQFINMS